MKMISSQVFAKQEVLKKKMKLSKNKGSFKRQVKLKIKKKQLWINKPLSIEGKDDEEMVSFLDLQAKKTKADQVVFRRMIKERYNLNMQSRNRLVQHILRTKSSLLKFIIACERLRRLIV